MIDLKADAQPRFSRSLVWQAMIAILCFALPLAFAPWDRLGQALAPSDEGAVRGRWEHLISWPGGSIVRRVVAASLSAEERASAVLYAIDTASGLHVSSDEGRTWTRARIPVPGRRLGVVQIVDLAVHPQDPTQVYVAVESPSDRPRPMVYWSQNGGHTWHVEGALGPARVHALAFDASADGLLAVTPGALVRLSHTARNGEFGSGSNIQQIPLEPVDFGTKITHFRLGGALAGDESGEAAGAHPEATLLIGTRDRGLWLFTGQESLEPLAIKDDPLSRYVRQSATIHALSVAPYDRWLYAGTEEGLYVSMDGGQSWFSVAQELRQERVLALLIEGRDEASRSYRIYAGLGGGGVLYSDDRGITWQPLAEGLGHISVFSLAMIPEDGRADAADLAPRTLYAGTDRGIWRLRLP